MITIEPGACGLGSTRVYDNTGPISRFFFSAFHLVVGVVDATPFFGETLGSRAVAGGACPDGYQTFCSSFRRQAACMTVLGTCVSFALSAVGLYAPSTAMLRHPSSLARCVLLPNGARYKASRDCVDVGVSSRYIGEDCKVAHAIETSSWSWRAHAYFLS